MSKEPIPGKYMACGYLLNDATKQHLYNLAAARPDFNPDKRESLYGEIRYILMLIVGYGFGKAAAFPEVRHNGKEYKCFALATTDVRDPLPCTPKPHVQERVAKALLRVNPPLWFHVIER